MNEREINQIQKLTNFFSLVQDETRLLILFSLRQKAMCVNELVKAIDRSQSLISHQLIILKKHNLVVGERKGNFIYYRIKDESLSKIIDTTLLSLNKEEK